MFKIDDLNRIYLGVQGENAARTIVIDVSEWLKTYPNGAVTIWSRRNGDNMNYTPTGIEFDPVEKTISWTPTAVDTFYAGHGMCGVELNEGDVVKKSKDIDTFVTASAADIPTADGNQYDYNRSINKPSINGQTLIGDMDFRELDMFDDENMSSREKAVSAGKAAEELAKKADKNGTEISSKVPKTDIVNNLSTTVEGKVLDARQGKALNDGKLDRSDVVANFSQTTTGKALDASKGRELYMNKVDKPSGVGAGKFLQTDQDGNEFWGGPAGQAEIAEDVEAWLVENVPSGTTIAIDNSLTIANAAAGAKKVGDELTGLNRAINPIISLGNVLQNYTISEDTFIRSQDGSTRNIAGWSAIVDFIEITDTDYITNTDIYVAFYDANKAFISMNTENNNKIAVPSGTSFFRLTWSASASPVFYVIHADGSYIVTFDGNGAEFVKASIPSSAVSGVNNTEKVLHERNECTANHISDGYYIRPQDGGERSEYPDYSAILSFIEIGAGDTIIHTGCIVYFYNSDKIYLGAYSDEGGNEPITNSKYIKLCWDHTINPNPTVVIRSSTGDAAVTFNGNNAEFIDESIPSSAVSGVDSVTSLAHKKDITENLWTNGYYIRSQDGDVRAYEGFKAVRTFIDISGVTEIIAYGTDLFFYTDATEFILYYNVRETWTTPPANAKYVRASTYQTETPYVYCKTAEGVITLFDPQDNVDFAEKCIPFSAVDAEGVPATLPPSVKLVAVTGGDYASISEANARCDGTYAMMILPGTYEDYWIAADDTYGNKSTKKSYIGISKNDCIIERHGTAYADDVFHTNGHTYMKNLSLKALKSTGAVTSGYALHLDNGWLQNGTAVFEDCYFYAEGRSAAGIGTRPGCNLIFRNCIFESDGEGSGAFYFHNDPNSPESNNQNIILENCTFHATNGAALYIQLIGDDNTNGINLTLINCTFYSDTVGVGTGIVTVDKTTYYQGQTHNIHITPQSHGNNIDLAAILAGS